MYNLFKSSSQSSLRRYSCILSVIFACFACDSESEDTSNMVETDMGGQSAGVTAGVTAGATAGVTAGATAGVTAGVTAGATAGATAGNMPNMTLSIEGTYLDEFDTNHEITADTWTITYVGTNPSVFHIAEIDEAQRYLVAQNDANNEYSPNLWSRFDWFFDSSNQLYFCQIAYDQASQEEASALNTANRDDLMMGCAGFSWSKLNLQNP
jgi:hypothetical protein